jgi:hypothetical protein
MRARLFGALACAALAAGLSGCQSGTAAGPNADAGGSGPAPRTADGRPDLRGVWAYATITPLERSDEFAGKEFLTPEEAVAFERLTAETQDRDRRDGDGEGGRGADGRTDLDRAYNKFWWDFGTNVVGTRRTSLIVDPPDGRIPALTPDGLKRAEDRRGLWTRDSRGGGSAGRTFDSAAERPLQERCLGWSTSGPPMLPGAYNNNVQLFQTRDHVAILNEMIHDHRIVPLDGRPQVGPRMRQWMGTSVGRWDGDTLVVDTVNLPGAFRASSEKMHLIERFTRVNADMLLYEFTVDDPETWTRPWTVQIPMSKSDEPIFEYACHEGNYSMVNVLSGARAQEKEQGGAGQVRRN